MKFRKNMLDTAKEELKKTAKDINSDATAAFRGKRGEIEEMPLFKKHAAKLTPEEIQRAQDVGILIGSVGLIVVILGVIAVGLIMLGWWVL